VTSFSITDTARDGPSLMKSQVMNATHSAHLSGLREDDTAPTERKVRPGYALPFVR